jgi:hypothetical protein
MRGGICHQKGKERGTWFEIQCVKNDIISKESRGEDASFERSALKSWSKYPDWKDAGTVFSTHGKLKTRGSKPESRGNILGEACPP